MGRRPSEINVICEEAQRHALQMGIERVAQIAHHVLANVGVEIGLADPDQPGNDRQSDHQTDVEIEATQITTRYGLVDDQLEQIGVGQPDHRRHDDRDQRQGHAKAIGTEEGENTSYG
jgi:hypothetical protein